MVYKRIPQNHRKYPHSSTNQTSSTTADSDTIKGMDQIPLPNEVEEAPHMFSKTRYGHKPSFLDSVTKHIQVDEILIIGLIFLLFTEGLEDDILIILLIYILVSGRD